jgi:hypothetical protein
MNDPTNSPEYEAPNPIERVLDHFGGASKLTARCWNCVVGIPGSLIRHSSAAEAPNWRT